MKKQSSHIESRSSGRIVEELPIHVSGTDVRGKDFIVRTRTLVLSRYGAKIVLKRELARKQALRIYCPRTQKEGSARVVGILNSELEEYSYGIEFLGQDFDFWNIPFPPATGHRLGTTN